VPETITDHLLNAIDSNDKALFDLILNYLQDNALSKETLEGLTMIIEAFLENPSAAQNRTAFIVDLSKYMINDFELLRTALPIAIKSFLSSEINKTTAVKVLGAKNKSVPLPIVHARFNALMKLKKGQCFHNSISRNWAIAGDIDWMIGTISVYDFRNTYIQDIELDSFLEKSHMFERTEKLEKIILIKGKPDKTSFIDIIHSSAVLPVSEASIKSIALETFVPKNFTLPEFNIWWESSLEKKSDSSAPVQPKLDINSARSIHELHTILRTIESSLKLITDEKVITHISEVLNQIKPYSKAKDYLNWVESISMLMPIIPEGAVNSLAPKDLKVYDVIWPKDEMNDICLNTWTQLKALDLTNWIVFTEKVLGQEYLKKALPLLPWKVWPAICSKLSVTFVESIIEEASKITSAEMLIWIWKNKEKLGSDTLSKLSYSVVIPAIYRSKTGALWQAGPKELRKLLLDSPEFLLQIIGKDAEENVINFIEYLNNSSALTSVDKQSLIVKLSRLSQKTKEIVNSDRVKKMIASKQTRAPQSPNSETYITSYKSFNSKIKELQELINKHIPENTEAIAVARAHGDLRENAEYSAAKERQKFLNEQRIILESRISSTQPTDFSDIQVNDTVVIGSTIEIAYDDGKKEVFHILGAWDSDPAKKYVSYETELGRAVTGKKVNEKVALPDSKSGTIASIAKISQSIIEELK